ncbi:M48 family metallopeptidase [Candidatus Peregrinibacteria bacterium]|nr:M48 family metallopeptidase [Candidatus Peregrinibacteria bacterium]
MNLFFFSTKPRNKKTGVAKRRNTISRTQRTVDLGQQEIPYTLTLRPGSRTIRLHVDPDKGLVVSAPTRAPIHAIESFIIQKKFWITRHLEESKKIIQRKQIPNGTAATILGESKVVIVKEHQLKRPYIAEKPQEIIVYAPQNQTIIKKTLENYLRKKFKVHLTKRLKEISNIMGTHYGTVTIRAQKSRWGSCSYRNNLNFNWKLIFFPLQVIDYVIMHELTHTVHHNHSEKFYDLLSHYCPDYKALRKSLHNAKTLF